MIKAHARLSHACFITLHCITLQHGNMWPNHNCCYYIKIKYNPDSLIKLTLKTKKLIWNGLIVWINEISFVVVLLNSYMIMLMSQCAVPMFLSLQFYDDTNGCGY